MNSFSLKKGTFLLPSHSNQSTSYSKINSNFSWVHLGLDGSNWDIKKKNVTFTDDPKDDQSYVELLPQTDTGPNNSTWESNSFDKHFHTSANYHFLKREQAYNRQRKKNQVRKDRQDPWQFVRRRMPSYSFGTNPKKTIFDIEGTSGTEVQFNNFYLSQGPKRQTTPMNKQPRRKEWFLTELAPDVENDDLVSLFLKYRYDQGETSCKVNMSNQLEREKVKLCHEYQIDISKARKTDLWLKDRNKGLLNFKKTVGRNKLSSYQQRMLRGNEKNLFQ